MKKAKLMLTAIGIFAIVAGALAFKATKMTKAIFCTNNSLAAKCSLSRYVSSTFAGANPVFTSYCTDAANSQKNCDILQQIEFIND